MMDMIKAEWPWRNACTRRMTHSLCINDTRSKVEASANCQRACFSGGQLQQLASNDGRDLGSTQPSPTHPLCHHRLLFKVPSRDLLHTAHAHGRRAYYLRAPFMSICASPLAASPTRLALQHAGKLGASALFRAGWPINHIPARLQPAAAMSTAASSAPQSVQRPGGPSARLAKPAHRVAGEVQKGPDVWSVFNPLAFPTAVNLGQGFMNFPPPDFVRNAFTHEASQRTDVHHYSHPKGRPRLRQAVAKHLSPSLHKPKDGYDPAPEKGAEPQVRASSSEPLDVETEVLITAGANGGMYSVLTAFLEPGDEVIFLEPFFDQYEMEVVYNDGVPVYVPLIPPPAKESGTTKPAGADEWKIDFGLLKQKLSSGKVRAIMLNTPHNPVGKVFTLEELQTLASLCIEHDLLVLSDEVYDCLTFDGKEHLRIASLEGMWNRTVTVGSAGKSFACTGWRIGWLTGPPHLLGPTLAAHTRILFCTNSPASEGAAIGLEQAPQHNFFPTQIKEYDVRRKLLMDTLDNLGIRYTIPHGAYFIMADFSPLQIPPDFQFSDFVSKQKRDFKMAYFLAKTVDVVCIPATAFASAQNAHLYENYLRFSFCKDGDIERAAERLQKIKPYLKQ